MDKILVGIAMAVCIFNLWMVICSNQNRRQFDKRMKERYQRHDAWMKRATELMVNGTDEEKITFLTESMDDIWGVKNEPK